MVFFSYFLSKQFLIRVSQFLVTVMNILVEILWIVKNDIEYSNGFVYLRVFDHRKIFVQILHAGILDVGIPIDVMKIIN